jgi:hypothetical protein
MMLAAFRLPLFFDIFSLLCCLPLMPDIAAIIFDAMPFTLRHFDGFRAMPLRR